MAADATDTGTEERMCLMTMETAPARRLWQLLEPIHTVVYFAQDKTAYAEAGLRGGWMGYFASRAAPMGEVSPEVVVATFYNFAPTMVRRAIPDAWSFASPEVVLDARMTVAERALRALLPDGENEVIEEAADLTRVAAEAGQPAGRPLFAAHAALPWPSDPLLSLWHGATLIREHRGDGHIAALLVAELDGCEANVVAAAAGMVHADTQRTMRGWTELEWASAESRLRERGWIDGDRLIAHGVESREELEDTTDRLAVDPVTALGDDRCDRLAELLSGLLSRAAPGRGLPYPNPIGVPPPA